MMTFKSLQYLNKNLKDLIQTINKRRKDNIMINDYMTILVLL